MSPGWVGFFCGAFLWVPFGVLMTAIFFNSKNGEWKWAAIAPDTTTRHIESPFKIKIRMNHFNQIVGRPCAFVLAQLGSPLIWAVEGVRGRLLCVPPMRGGSPGRYGKPPAGEHLTPWSVPRWKTRHRRYQGRPSVST